MRAEAADMTGDSTGVADALLQQIKCGEGTDRRLRE
jgi:hypothetical protein